MKEVLIKQNLLEQLIPLYSFGYKEVQFVRKKLTKLLKPKEEYHQQLSVTKQYTFQRQVSFPEQLNHGKQNRCFMSRSP